MRRAPLAVAAFLALIPARPSAEGFDDSDGAVLAKPLEPRRPDPSFAAMLSGEALKTPDPVVRPAPPAALPPAARAPLPRVELPAYPELERPISDRRPYGLWPGAAAPLELPPSRETPAPDAERLADAPASAGAASGDGRMFVNLEMEVKEGGELKDAVAEASRASGFVADARFPILRSEAASRSVSVWGWLPSANLGLAARLPAVRRVTASSPARPSVGTAVSELLIGVRVRDGADPTTELARVRRELSAAAGVVWRRIIGYQAVPGSRDLAVIALADVPIRSLAKVLEHSAVLRVAAPPVDKNALEPERYAPVPHPAPIASGPVRFFQFALAESPALLIVTLVLLVPSLAAAARRLSRLL